MKIFEKLTMRFMISLGTVVAFLYVVGTQSQTIRPRTEVAPVRFVFTTAAGTAGSNQVTVQIALQDNNGNPIAGAPFDFWVSDDPNCLGLSATVASGTVGMLATTAGPISTAVQGVGTAPLGTLVSTAFTTSGPAAISPDQSTFANEQTRGGSTIAVNRIFTSNVGTAKFGIVDSAKTLWTPCAFYEPGRIRGVGTKFVVGSFGTWLLPYNAIGKLQERIWKGGLR